LNNLSGQCYGILPISIRVGDKEKLHCRSVLGGLGGSEVLASSFIGIRIVTVIVGGDGLFPSVSNKVTY
jgi:hypothetical protein